MYNRLLFLLSCLQITLLTFFCIALFTSFPLFVSFMFVPLIAPLYFVIVEQIRVNLN
jgi:hypothetical protein